ncbi:histidine--tRNA ligase [Coxiella endosymbiont of Amblyomma sculptum]|uniref:histidine--tRNA ligase n=1 Tax=Coxiella endosymbiont of Amblyomma sculptum TaxID=2487929 RepID=UPI00132EDDDD|nr:histidine--tRNA ligase [Coxiella endosymbiont of Amblyomma sculptum]QHG92521.1 histidine--tRNA ligase [Coxiella endosymbiont of Amblyomma sculptum]
MNKTIKSVRGMRDILPNEALYWSFLEETFRALVMSYGYREIRLPIVEQTALFRRSIGTDTDVEKEMYTFWDRSGRSVSLRPEGTTGCVRAAIQNGLFYKKIQKLWYVGPMFRYERPQKGRYRQFYQAGIEAYGVASPIVDVELILIGHRFWKFLGLEKYVVLELNTLGTQACRQFYRKRLIDYLQSRKSELDEDSQRRLITNPLRILDSKNPNTKSIVAESPKLLNHLDDESRHHWNQLQTLLDQKEFSYVVNPDLVRGLDYYTHTVFEWVVKKKDVQRNDTICAGGRYDDLVEQMGGPRAIPAAGFAIGLERTVLLLRSVRECVSYSDIYFVVDGERAAERGLMIAEHLHDALPNLIIETHLDGSFKSQFKRADTSGAQWALIIGKKEMKTNRITVKNLRELLPKQQLDINELIIYLQNKLINKRTVPFTTAHTT